MVDYFDIEYIILNMKFTKENNIYNGKHNALYDLHILCETSSLVSDITICKSVTDKTLFRNPRFVEFRLS